MTSTTSTPPRTTASLLEFSDVTKTFPDGTHALDPVSFGVGAGEFVTVVGPSGCGKSTLLRIASGLDRPTTGSVRVLPAREPRPGKVGERRSEGSAANSGGAADPAWPVGGARETQIGYVFQDATLLQWRTVRRNVELFAELANVPKAERVRRVEESLTLVGLDGFASKYPKQLSGGMRMRASLARSLVMDPDVFLFDEPFGALDEITRERLNDELLQLFRRQGFGALFITHSISEAVFLSSKVLVMSARPGRIVASFDVPFGYPRSPELRFDAAFAAVAGEVSHALRGAHE